MALHAWLWGYDGALGIWLGFGCMALGFWFWGHSLANKGEPSSKVYTHWLPLNQPVKPVLIVESAICRHSH